jgi:hypothetical protein
LRRPFEVSPEELAENIDEFVAVTFADLQSSFMVVPRGDAFAEYPRFRDAYLVLKRETSAFRDLSISTVWEAMREDGLAFGVLRSILGLTPPELAEIASQETNVHVPQDAARKLDKACRADPEYVRGPSLARSPKTRARLEAMVEKAIEYVEAGAPPGAAGTVHRLDKFDTRRGIDSLQHATDHDVPYAVLLYERYLGRPLATHKDSVSELVGEAMEGPVESRLSSAGIVPRKIKRAEKVEGFEQAPDFVIPDEWSPAVVIEAKITNDDGTARDKVDRIVNLVTESRRRAESGGEPYQVVACIDGRGFGVRKERMRRLLLQLDGKVFTLNTLDQLVTHTALKRYVTKP